MANDPLSSSRHHRRLLALAGGVFSDDEAEEGDEEEGRGFSAAVAFPSFWPPFPALLSDSDSDAPFPPLHVDRREDASAFLGLGFHDEDDDEWAPPDEDGEVALPLCWDCLQLEDPEHQRWDLGVGDDAEWEQVIARGEEEVVAAEAVRSLEWEVLLAANSLGTLVIDGGDEEEGGIAAYFLDDADADDVLFGQLAAEVEHDLLPGKGGRPAAKAAVEGLQTVVVAEADAQCAVCKDGIEAGEGARRLPCAHLYHDACILPWLTIRNTCPLCRHELPTDDPEYETWKARRAAGAGAGGDADASGDGDRYDAIRLP